MKKTLRALISFVIALTVTSASAVQIGCPGLERTPNTTTVQSSVTGK
ncbi:hypothetical protein [Deinococcus humi]|uniref:Uncharacterized protein n=1 Tax=Deinococcus humi TaxID=662880 RepID=A0A7W8NFL9_9DEIO|nr:hypothetical protein [Deinococcus humi]MBB5365579.1 hypothetical protein [Deinococcus humi]